MINYVTAKTLVIFMVAWPYANSVSSEKPVLSAKNVINFGQLLVHVQVYKMRELSTENPLVNITVKPLCS